MGTLEELVGIIDSGELVDLLAETFGGERGVVRPGKEIDFIVTFPSEEATPEIGPVMDVVCGLFRDKCFKCVIGTSDQNSFSLMVFTSNINDGLVVIVVTTKYPFPAPGDGRVSLRVSTTISN